MTKEETLHELILGLGADVCGIAAIEQFSDAPAGFSPKDVYADCQSVIVLGIALPKGVEMVNPRMVYQRFNDLSKEEVDKIALAAAQAIEKRFDCIAVPVPCDGPYEAWDNETLTGHGLISVKHAAVQAGLGQLGKSTLLLNPRYGNRLTIGLLLTNLALKPDKPCENICLADCHKCVDACPVRAIENGRVNQKLCRPNTYGKNERGFDVVNCNTCRTSCPMRFGLFKNK